MRFSRVFVDLLRLVSARLVSMAVLLCLLLPTIFGQATMHSGFSARQETACGLAMRPPRAPHVDTDLPYKVPIPNAGGATESQPHAHRVALE